MSRLSIYVIFLQFLLLIACQSKNQHSVILNEAALLFDSIPSEALLELEKIRNFERLEPAEQAEYNCIYIKSMFRSGNTLTSDSIIKVTSEYYLNNNDSVSLHRVLYYNGYYHYRNRSYDSAVYYFNKALNYIPAIDKTESKANYKRIIGYSYIHLGDTKQAVNSQKEALQYSRELNDSTSLIYSLLSLGDAYTYNKDTEKSLDSYNKALEVVRSTNDQEMEANILNIISGIYESDYDFEKALEYKNLSQSVKRNRMEVPAVNLYRAVLFDKQNMLDSAQYYAELSIKGADSYVADMAYLFLSRLEEKQGRYANALNFSKSSENAFKTFLSGTHIADLQQKYEKEKLENENNQLKIKQAEHQFYLLIISFLLLLLLIAIYFIRVKNKRKSEKIAHENKVILLQHENLLLTQQKEISLLREKESLLRESLFKKINFFNKIPSLSKDEDEQQDKQVKIKITRSDWQELKNGIQDTYPEFFEKLRQTAPSLSDDDVRFCCLLKINVNMQDLSDIYCVSKSAISKRKYRLKTEKFQITDTNLNLDTILQQI